MTWMELSWFASACLASSSALLALSWLACSFRSTKQVTEKQKVSTTCIWRTWTRTASTSGWSSSAPTSSRGSSSTWSRWSGGTSSCSGSIISDAWRWGRMVLVPRRPSAPSSWRPCPITAAPRTALASGASSRRRFFRITACTLACCTPTPGGCTRTLSCCRGPAGATLFINFVKCCDWTRCRIRSRQPRHRRGSPPPKGRPSSEGRRMLPLRA
mmetsp:Transcript_48581/g.139503  ORF Transcript_48581/g.139503 Transcript_48581/m.139503 type:complete len:214 (-) Transcript_48581:410-1051(-)